MRNAEKLARGSPVGRFAAGVLSLAALLLAVVVAMHYPIRPALVVALTMLWTIASYRWPVAWIAIVPAVLPAIGFAPWTGWFVAEEFDLLLAGVVAAGYARVAVHGELQRRPAEISTYDSERRRAISLTAVLLVAGFAASAGIALVRGYAGANSPSLNWTQGYFDALNSMRLFKSFGWSLLLLPLVVANLRDSESRAVNALSWGLVGGLFVVAVGALWERMAFPGLLNFSTDYRTTSVFWEMHVGGAALDGYLALTIPFALWLALDSTKRWYAVVAGGVLLLAGYAALTTFSRGVFLAVPFGIAVFMILRFRQHAAKGQALRRRDVAAGIAFFAITSAVASGAFADGGYRALLALLMAFAALTHAGPSLRSLAARWLWLAVVTGVLAGVVATVIGQAVAKGPYVVHALVFIAFLLLAWVRTARGTANSGFVLAAAPFALVVTAIGVGVHWGGPTALRTAGIAGVAMAAIILLLSLRRSALLFDRLRHQAMVVGTATMIAATMAVFSGGAYIGERFATSNQDLEGRQQHWSWGLGMLSGPFDWWLGKGYGRFPANYFYHIQDAQLPGSYAWKDDAGNGYLALSGARYSMSWGDLFRMSQRVPVAPGPYSALLDVRNSEDLQIHVEICEKHLLYNEACAVSTVNIKADTSEGWHQERLVLDGRELTGGPWYAPRLAFLSIAVASSGRNVAIDNVSVIGPDGRNLVANGDFAKGTERWFFTSDRHHLPWHIKNMFLNVLFEQGILGLVAFVALLVAFFWRLVLGTARMHAMAPALAASLAGFLAVGAFDSLLDVPRVAWLFYMLVNVGLVLRGRSRGRLDPAIKVPHALPRISPG